MCYGALFAGCIGHQFPLCVARNCYDPTGRSAPSAPLPQRATQQSVHLTRA